MLFRLLTLFLFNVAAAHTIVVDPIYWHTSETMEWAIQQTVENQSQTLSYKEVSYEVKPGFKVGFGIDLPHDHWDVLTQYTWFNTNGNDRFQGVIISPFLCSKLAFMNPYESAKMVANLRFNMFDLELRRNIEVTERLKLRPLIGLKGGWIDQALRTKWKKNEITAYENLKNNFSGGGLQLGINGTWLFTPSFGLTSDFKAAFMWGHFYIEDDFKDTLSTHVKTSVGNRNFGSLSIQGFLGFYLEIEPDFSSKFGYEIQDFFNQYQILDNATGTHSNDLILQGLTVSACLNF